MSRAARDFSQPGDAYHLDVEEPDGMPTRHRIYALEGDDRGAFRNAARRLEDFNDPSMPEDFRNPTGELRRANGELVAEGDASYFRSLS